MINDCLTEGREERLTFKLLNVVAVCHETQPPAKVRSGTVRYDVSDTKLEGSSTPSRGAATNHTVNRLFERKPGAKKKKKERKGKEEDEREES